MTVLVLTCKQDVTADMVVTELHERGVPLVRLDPADLPGEVALSAEYVRGDFHGHLSTSGRLVSMCGLRSIWVRRPGTPGADVTEQTAWVTAECEQALYGVLRCTDARWMNHPDAAARARYKPWQLQAAHRSGFAVPATVITTFPKVARQFAENHQDLIVKPISGTHPTDPPMALPTTRIPPDVDFTEVAAGPTLLQQHIPKLADIRLTCVGEQMFAARKASDPGQVDGRFAENDHTWEAAEMPARIAQAVRAYMRAARLAYGAFDFAEDNEGTWWFLECNQGGQFGFIQLATGQPIAEAVATWLALDET
ncbi:ATP-grasp ribosomal peptide maturase [Wenjunlia tyrosinilytica]|uniref:ATP-grasp ribosomal peptide maturase n=1 Tax=Wenjunlia tyrosinilytica TaxID=1544741 RepID=A0A917ZRV5_9ACTN|nr:ATP-grasp ribosomal peptide maturase [Wenjunlia tyrosinilytica]GGO90524.1 ATP-grasp ribosomal peptide maturase [Wenjunlia tyrosinilytica]